MRKVKRIFSVLIRKLQSRKKIKITLKYFNEWRKELSAIPLYTNNNKKLLIIRLDDIGDYLLFRNFLIYYKKSSRWKGYEITLLGNATWKELFDVLDHGTTDRAIWVNKQEYLKNKVYRHSIWQKIRKEGFEAVVCPSRTRPILLDDICMLATGAMKSFAASNLTDAVYVPVSNDLYQNIYIDDSGLLHEFAFNRAFTSWCCETDVNISKPEIKAARVEKVNHRQNIICFIGASSGSKRWPAKRWIECIQLIIKQYPYKIFIAGGWNDLEIANIICSETTAVNFVGKTSLKEMIDITTNAVAVITNDTMAAHLAVSCNTAVVIISNGNNWYRFMDYSSIGVTNARVVYPVIFQKKLKQGLPSLTNYTAVTADIATIKCEKVVEQLSMLINITQP